MFNHIPLASLYLLLLAIQLFQVFHSPLSHDDAWMMNNAKNWAVGPGYGQTIFDQFYPFFSGTGNDIIVFVGLGAIATWLFGNAYWVPALAGVFLIQVLLLCCFFALRNIRELEDKLWQAASLLLFVWMFCATGMFTHRPEYSFLWYSFHGDIPAALCVLLTALLMAGGEISGKRMWLISLAIGVASQIKLLTLLPHAVLCGAYCLREYRTLGIKKLIGKLLCLSLFTVGIETVWLLYDISQTGWEGFVAQQVFRIQTIMHMGGRQLAPLLGKQEEMPNLANQLILLFNQFGLFLLPFALFYAVRYWNLVFRERSSLSQAEFYASALMMAGWVMVPWFLFFSTKMMRYVVPLTLYVMSGITLLLIRRRKDFPYAIYGLILFCILGRGDDNFFILFREVFGSYRSRDDMLAAKDALIKLREQGYRLTGCGINFEMEYLLDGTRHFTLCDDARKGSQKFAVLNTYITLPNYHVITRLQAKASSGSVAAAEHREESPSWLAEECIRELPSEYFEVWRCDHPQGK